MSNKEINIEIAKLLGFKFIEPTEGFKFTQIVYPDSWKDEIKAMPVTKLPDFLALMQKSRDIDKMFNYGIPTVSII